MDRQCVHKAERERELRVSTVEIEKMASTNAEERERCFGRLQREKSRGGRTELNKVRERRWRQEDTGGRRSKKARSKSENTDNYHRRRRERE